MKSLGIVSKVREPTEWVNSMVLINQKNLELRVCLDPRNLNKFIKKPHCQLPTVEEIFSKFTEAKIFSVLDTNRAF